MYIYQKASLLINCIIYTVSREEDLVLDVFSGSSKIYDITYERIFQVLFIFYSSLIFFESMQDLCYLTWLNYFFGWLGTTITCSLHKGRNCISIDNDPVQFNYIKQIISVVQIILNELQEVGLKKWEFSKTLVVKMSK